MFKGLHGADLHKMFAATST